MARRRSKAARGLALFMMFTSTMELAVAGKEENLESLVVISVGLPTFSVQSC